MALFATREKISPTCRQQLGAFSVPKAVRLRWRRPPKEKPEPAFPDTVGRRCHPRRRGIQQAKLTEILSLALGIGGATAAMRPIGRHPYIGRRLRLDCVARARA